MLKNLFLLFLIISTTACVSGRKFKSYQVNEKEFSQNNKSIIITKLVHKYKFLGFEREANVDFIISKIDPNYIDINKRFSYKFPNDFSFRDADSLLSQFYEFYIAMIEPGEYVLEGLSYTYGNVKYVSTLDGLQPSPKGEIYIYGKFKVSPGEVVYLGNVNVSFENKQSILLIEDKYDDAVQYFVSKYPSLRHKDIKKEFMLVNSIIRYKKPKKTQIKPLH